MSPRPTRPRFFCFFLFFLSPDHTRTSKQTHRHSTTRPINTYTPRTRTLTPTLADTDDNNIATTNEHQHTYATIVRQTRRILVNAVIPLLFFNMHRKMPLIRLWLLLC